MLDSFKVRLCVIVLSVTVCMHCRVYMFVYFVGLKFLWILLVSYPFMQFYIHYHDV